MKTKNLLAVGLLLPAMSFAQSDLATALKGGELILSGISLFKSKKGTSINSDVIETVCFKKNSIFLKMYTFCLPNYPNYLFIFDNIKTEKQ